MTAETLASVPPWGHQHPNCKGEAAIAFFTADLARTIEEHLSNRQIDAEVLAQAQRAVDALLRVYVTLRAAPHAFDDQTVRLSIAMQARADGGSPMPYVALETSRLLEDMIIDIQERERTGLA